MNSVQNKQPDIKGKAYTHAFKCKFPLNLHDIYVFGKMRGVGMEHFAQEEQVNSFLIKQEKNKQTKRKINK